MDGDCEMNHQFAKRLRHQQMSSPSLVVLRDLHNTTPIHVPACTDDEEMSCDVKDLQKPCSASLELSARKSQVQRWLFPPTDDTPPPSQEDDPPQSEPDVDVENICDPCLSFPPSNCSTPHKQILEERLSTPVIAPSSMLKRPSARSVNVSADRYIPARLPGNMEARFSMIPDDRSLGSPSKVSRKTRAGEEDEGRHAYSCLLRNELLGTNIEALKNHPSSSQKNKNFFHYSSSIENEQNIEAVAPYSPWSVSSKSQRLLRSSRKSNRQISRIPFKVLDAPELADDYYLNLVDWSSDNMLCVGLGSCVYLWAAASGEITRLCDLSSVNNGVTSVAWSDQGNYLAVGTHNGYVQVWDVTRNKQVHAALNGHSARVGTLAWSGDTLSSGSHDCSILQRDIRVPSQANSMRRLVSHAQEICGLKWSSDNQYLASGGNDNQLYVWNMHSISPMQTYTEHQAAVKAIAWSPHHHGLLASGGGTADRSIRFWNTLTGQPMQCVDTGSQVCNLAWSKHSSELVSTHGYPDNTIQVWKYPGMKQLAKLRAHARRVSYMAASPDGEDIVTGSGDETLRFWKVFSKSKSLKRSKSTLSLYNSIR